MVAVLRLDYRKKAKEPGRVIFLAIAVTQVISDDPLGDDY